MESKNEHVIALRNTDRCTVTYKSSLHPHPPPMDNYMFEIISKYYPK